MAHANTLMHEYVEEIYAKITSFLEVFFEPMRLVLWWKTESSGCCRLGFESQQCLGGDITPYHLPVSQVVELITTR